ncbi:hypothetical protein Malapachy_0838 [Malassezia pachydermatis]|uniref:Uncharacterized protein n=1 Tax=Malassezia pachydermatis TaxID=77020 RepID=A0A0M8MLI2_9BASI|nr:hypothetical protein Malapachy_0838 [Malassezia pachydermatis]KOS14906.1 hypothetical protein Malapachy_0838 [Malassezia pachydermatis]
MPPTAGVYVSLVRHAPIPSLHGGAQWTLDKEVAQDQNTATAVQSTYAALGSLLSRNQISAVYTAPDPESVHTGTLILHDPPTYGRVTPVSSPLLLHTPLSSSSMQDLHEYQDLFQQIWQRLKAAPETQPDDLDVRAMAALAVLILPWLHTPSSQPLHVVLVTAGVLADRLLHCLFHLHGSNPSVLRPMSERPVSMPAAPLQPGAFHQEGTGCMYTSVP